MPLTRKHFPIACVIASVAFLAASPAYWLWTTWTDPSWNSNGLYVAGLVVGLAVWSLSSPRLGRLQRYRRFSVYLLLSTACARLTGQLLGVNLLSAVALCVDVYALGLLCGLQYRRRALSSGWIAVLFALSLPFERVLQRVLGFALQQISAHGACALLSLAPGEVDCQGIRILINRVDVLVDLPCSGASGLLLLLTGFVVLAALRGPSFKAAIVGLLIVLFSAVLHNVLRISALALQLAWPPLGIDAMAAPWHELTGMACLSLALLPILVWANRLAHRQTESLVIERDSDWSGYAPLRIQAGPAVVFAVLSIVIVNLSARPIDVSPVLNEITLPASIGGMTARPSPLDAKERNYFTRYGGGAARAAYGSHGLLLVQTKAPLRHLHAPDECLRGAGHRVRYLGVDYGLVPTALYRSTDAQGQQWRIAVTFRSDSGQLTHSVAQAVWNWLHQPSTQWTMVQRISPWTMAEAETRAWDAAAIRALDLAYAEPSNARRRHAIARVSNTKQEESNHAS